MAFDDIMAAATKAYEYATDEPEVLPWRALRAAVSRALSIQREEIAQAIETADTRGWPGGRGSDVDGCQERAARIAREHGKES